MAWEPIRLDILFPSAGAAVAHGPELPRYFKIAWGMPCKNKPMVNFYTYVIGNGQLISKCSYEMIVSSKIPT